MDTSMITSSVHAIHHFAVVVSSSSSSSS